MNRMHGGEVRAKDPFALEQRGGRAALDHLALFDLALLFRKVDVKWGLAPPGPRRDRAHRAGIDSPDTVDRSSDADSRPILELVDALRPVVGVAVGERSLRFVEGPAV